MCYFASVAITKECDMEPLISSDDLAEKLSVKVTTVRAWTRAGKVPCVRIGQTVRYRLSDVLKALEAK